MAAALFSPRRTLSSPRLATPRTLTPAGLSAARAHPAACKALGDGLAHATAHRAAHFAIHALDVSGRRRREGGEPFVVSIRGPGAVTTSVRDCQDGTYSVGWVANVSGVYWIVISLHGEHIQSSPFAATVTVAKADAAHCRMSGRGLNEATAGARARFRIDFADSIDRPVAAESIDLAIATAAGDGEGGGSDGGGGSGSGGAEMGGWQRDAARAAGFRLGGLTPIERTDGAYHAEYSVEAAGRYELHVRLRATGEALPGSPSALCVYAARGHAAHTELLGVDSPPLCASAGSVGSLTLRAVDKLHNLCDAGGDNVREEQRRTEPNGGDGLLYTAWRRGREGL